jgi:dipeptidyl aminopeptidase/acylaminoacyl peptidase
VTESNQIVEALKKQGTVVWYVMAKDEGHGFQKKDNRDFEFYATVEFLQQYLSK